MAEASLGAVVEDFRWDWGRSSSGLRVIPELQALSRTAISIRYHLYRSEYFVAVTLPRSLDVAIWYWNPDNRW